MSRASRVQHEATSGAKSSIAERERGRLLRARRELNGVREIEGPLLPLHRVVPVSQEIRYTGPTEYRCAHCGLGPLRFPDEFEDSACSATPLPGLDA